MLIRMFIEKPALLYSVLCAVLCALISDLQANIAAATGNVGLFLIEPIMGDIIDKNGPQGICLLGAGLFAASFSGLTALYSDYFVSHTYMLTIIFLFLMGAGAAAVEEAAFSTIARNFPSQVRGTMLGLLYMFFCLSGMFYSWMSTKWFVNTDSDQSGTYRFLITVLLITTLTPLVLLPGLRWLPGADAILEAELTTSHSQESSGTIGNNERLTKQQADNTNSKLLAQTNERADLRVDYKPNYAENSSENSPLLITAYENDDADDDDGNNDDFISGKISLSSYSSHTSASSLKEILHDVDFWLFWVATCMVVGVDLMYINNVGHVVEELWQESTQYSMKLYDIDESNQAQLTLNKSIMISSVAGCIAGLMTGYVSDWCVASGAIFTIVTVIVSDYWGTEHCGRNVGLLGWAIALGSQLFSAMFGAIFDARQDQPRGCSGRMCYRDGFFAATAGCMFGLVLSLVIYKRRVQRGI
ncbi:major facilitator superfamily domain-containing protein [Syncephalis plumigaleata]|nr:major facilitator superfamily domain-containing protein [Syncephalis plumigaleata]